MGLWKSIGSVYLLAWIVQFVLFWLIERNSTGYFRAHVIHVGHIVKIELLMVLGSFFIWKRITNVLFEATSAKQKDADNGDDSRGKKTYRQFAGSPSSPRAKHIRSIISVLLAGFLLCSHSAHFLNYFANSVEPRLISLVCMISFGFWIHLVAFLVGFSIGNFLIRYMYSKSWGKMFLSPLFSRSTLIHQLLTNVSWQTVAAVILALLFGIVQMSAAGNVRVKRVEITLQRLPNSMDGFKIALLTDMHAGPSVGRKRFMRAVDMTNQLSPDIVTIVGDLVDGTVDDLKRVVEPIGQLKAKYGVYFSTGNHEMYYGEVDDWLAYLGTLNVKVMRNENVNIQPRQNGKEASDEQDGPHLCLAGADDIFAEKTGVEGHWMDLRAAVNGCNANAPIILMAHNPRAAKKALEMEGKIDLILCGHTHAGQMYVLAPIMYANMPFFHGLYEYSKTGTYIYVSAGVFYMGAPMKQMGTSEIILITLKSPG